VGSGTTCSIVSNTTFPNGTTSIICNTGTYRYDSHPGRLVPLVVSAGAGADSIEEFFGSIPTPRVISVDSPGGGPTDGGVLLRFYMNSGPIFITPPLTVSIGGRVCSTPFEIDSQVRCELPAGEGRDLPIQIGDVDGSYGGDFTFDYDPPSLSVVSPTEGPSVGFDIIIAGSNFGLTSTVTVGGINCPISSRTHIQVVCRVPPGSGSANVVLTAAGQVSNARVVNYQSNPALTGLAPTLGPESGFDIVVSGFNFGLTPTVTVGGVDCPVSSATDTRAMCRVPPGSSSSGGLDVVVTRGRFASNPSSSLMPPALVNYAPDPCTSSPSCLSDGLARVCVGAVYGQTCVKGEFRIICGGAPLLPWQPTLGESCIGAAGDTVFCNSTGASLTCGGGSFSSRFAQRDPVWLGILSTE
jgi:hypothetical protein